MRAAGRVEGSDSRDACGELAPQPAPSAETENFIAADAWLFFAGDSLPVAEWTGRAVPGFLVRITPDEISSLPSGRHAPSAGIASEDRPLASLVARGLRAQSIADELGVSLRTTHRRLAKLRRRLNVASTAELARLLRATGFE